MTSVLPGDVVHVVTSEDAKNASASLPSAVKLGAGLAQASYASSSSAAQAAIEANPAPAGAVQSTLVATVPGPLGSVTQKKRGPQNTRRYLAARWVEGESNRYTPAVGDNVVGQITNRHSEGYVVTLLTSHVQCVLPALAFEGATKRTKPTLRPGGIVYARVVLCDAHSEPELTCVDPSTGKADGLGGLKVADRETGFATLVRVHPLLSAALLRPAPPKSEDGDDKEQGGHTLLALVSSFFAFEAAVGANGMIWFRAEKPSQLIALRKVLAAADARMPTTQGDGTLLTAQMYARRRGRLSRQEVEAIVRPFL